MRKLSRKACVTMLTLALIISQLIPTGMIAVSFAAEEEKAVAEEMKKAPAEEEKKAEAIPAEADKKLEAAAEEKNDAAEYKEVKEVDLTAELSTDVKELNVEEKAEAEEKDEAAEPEAEKETAKVRDLMYFKKYNKMFSVDPVVYYDYDGENHTLYPTFNDVSKENSGVIDSQGRWIIHLKRLNEVNTQTYYLTPKFVGVTTQKNAGTYSVGAVIEAAKIEDAAGNDVTDRVDANWGNNDYYTFGVVSYKGVIRPRDISVKLNDVTKVYGEKDPDQSTWATLTSGELAKNDKLSDIVKLSRTPGEDVGEYPFMVKQQSTGGGSQEAKKSPAKSAAKAEMAEKEVADERVPIAEDKIDVSEKEKEETTSTTSKIGNYNVTFVKSSGKLTITPKPVTITALDNGKVKGSKDPVLKYTVEGLLDGEELPDGFVYDHKRKAGEEVGKYPINLKINLNAEASGGNDSVEPGPIEYIDPEPIEYDEKDYEEKDFEEAVWEKEYEELAEMECAKEEVYEYSAKKAVENKAEQKLEVMEAIAAEALPLERIDIREDLESLAELVSEEKEKEAVEELKPENPVVITPADPSDTLKPTSNNFKSGNYTYTLVPGVFTITDNNKGGGTTTNNNNNNGGGNNGGGEDITVAEVNDAVTPAAAPAASAAATTIPDAAAPLAGNGNAAWALVNLICTILTALGALVAVFRRKEEEDEDENAYKAEDDEADNRGKKMFAAKAAGILSGIAAIITFILTEDMRLPMILIDRWTLLMVIILAVQIVAAVLNKKAAELEDDEEAETQTAN